MYVDSLITHLQLKNMSVMYESVHAAITFQLLKMSSITTPKQTGSNIPTRYIFQRIILGKILAILPIYIMKKISLEVLCKQNHFCYWNLHKHLPNLVNVATLQATNEHNEDKSCNWPRKG